MACLFTSFLIVVDVQRAEGIGLVTCTVSHSLGQWFDFLCCLSCSVTFKAMNLPIHRPISSYRDALDCKGFLSE